MDFWNNVTDGLGLRLIPTIFCSSKKRGENKKKSRRGKKGNSVFSNFSTEFFFLLHPFWHNT